ncbi:MAG TPA: hypothetical protein VFI65_25000 [Streptosporangiaceae bacterium]|nr:hypothetical protein [Streptosporangiaceae bacterium]
MRRLGPAVVAVSAIVAVVWGAGPTPGAAAARAGSWGRAMPLPGLAALNKGGDAEVNAVSCPSAGNCTVGGTFDSNENGFVASERHGRWSKAIKVPGLAALSKNGETHLQAVSCGSATDCAAGGYYFSSDHPDGDEHSFVAVEQNGRWGNAIQLRGLTALNKGGDAEVDSLSCPSKGSCAAAGTHAGEVFLAAERNGRWGNAFAVPGLAALNQGVNSDLGQVSCGSAGNCVVGGIYGGRSGPAQGFLATERNGTWGKAMTVPGLSKHEGSEVDVVSCSSAGNCTAAGAGGSGPVFVVSERNGHWGKATALPGLAALNTSGLVELDQMSCSSEGNCAAGGTYQNLDLGFVASERNGRWGKATELPSPPFLTKGREAEVVSVSCAAAGICAAGGDYADRSDHDQGFVASAADGAWGKAVAVPGLAALNKGGLAGVTSVSCAPGGACTAVGSYGLRNGGFNGFVVTRTR